MGDTEGAGTSGADAIGAAVGAIGRAAIATAAGAAANDIVVALSSMGDPPDSGGAGLQPGSKGEGTAEGAGTEGAGGAEPK